MNKRTIALVVSTAAVVALPTVAALTVVAVATLAAHVTDSHAHNSGLKSGLGSHRPIPREEARPLF